jgi:4-alpha-glucanotransferase
MPVVPEPGVHRVEVAGRHGHGAATLLVAPRRVPGGGARRLGVFAPLYALHEDGPSSTGDLATLERFASWAAGHGTEIVGTLPLLATFSGWGREPCDPSPYSPVSRRYWNEVYLDVARLPELAPRERAVVDPAPGRYVDLPALARARRPIVEEAARRLRSHPERARALRSWLDARQDVRDYARFRAAVEAAGPGASTEDVAIDPEAVAYHEYCQWAMDAQLGDLATAMRARGQALYLDLPVGAHRDGFDVAMRPGDFAIEATVGAPPDAFQTAGQDWGFPLPHPVAMRASGYELLRSSVEAHLRHAAVLRIDHVMGLHRLWAIPPGAGATDGAYVAYSAEEQWAVLCLAAARHGARLVGENLGTVPDETRRALARHDVLGMWVLPFETPEHEPPRPPGRREVACLDTHDLPMFSALWHDLPPSRRGPLLDVLRRAGALDTTYGEVLEPRAVLDALLAWLGASAAEIVLVTLEDLWLEEEAQNVPGTAAHQAPNFRRRVAHSLADLHQLDDLDDLDAAGRILDRVARARRERAA